MNRLLQLRLRCFRRALAVAALASCVTGTSAWAGLFDDEEARRAILDLRQKVQAAEQKLAEEKRRSTEDVAQLRSSFVELQSQLDGLRGEVAKLRGQNEQIARDLADMQRLHKETAQSVDERLRRFEPARMSLDGREFSVEPDEKREYDAAMALFRKGEFAAAQTAFVGFLNRRANSGYRPSALFWLGNAQYAIKNYKEAMASFRTLTTQTPDHVRVPEAILAIANCQLEMKDAKAARKTLEDLMAMYPKSEAAQAAKERLARFQ